MPKIFCNNNSFDYKEETDLLSILKDNKIELDAPCNGKGTCGKCIVKIKNPKKPSITDKKFISEKLLEEGYRLACSYVPKGDTVIEILKDNSSFLKEDLIMEGESLNHFKVEEINISKEVLKDFYSVENYLKISYGLEDVYLEALKKIKQIQKKYFGILYGKTLLDLRLEFPKPLYGVAVDIGSTTLCISIVDINNGTELERITEINKLTSYGADIFSRIEEVIKNYNSLYTMREILLNQIEKAILSMIEENNLLKENVIEINITGNTTMLSIIQGLDISFLGKHPYTPLRLSGATYNKEDFGFKGINPFYIRIFPCISAFVGGDIVSGCIYTNFFASKAIEILIDMGTNGEIVLNNRGNFYATSCALGPCLEGMNISFGVRANSSSIDKVEICNGKIKTHCIGNEKPSGICGSGIISVVSELLRENIITKKGAFTKDEEIIDRYKDYFDVENKRFFLSLDKDIYISQKDIRQVQLAKGALRSGIKALLEEAKLDFDEIEKVYIAGQFGSYVRREDIVGIDILPKNLMNRIDYIGNSSLKGAILSIFHPDSLIEVEEKMGKVMYVNLSDRKDYDRLFSKSLIFNVKED